MKEMIVVSNGVVDISAKYADGKLSLYAVKLDGEDGGVRITLTKDQLYRLCSLVGDGFATHA